jgi:tripartite-type tricarboxylate transporter receptor subunit TctC
MITQGTHVFNLSLYKTLRYDPEAIIPITPISAVSNVMTVHPSNPANTPLEVAAAARAAPGQLSFASGGIGTSHHLGGVLFASIAGVDIKHCAASGFGGRRQQDRRWRNHHGLLQPADGD